VRRNDGSSQFSPSIPSFEGEFDGIRRLIFSLNSVLVEAYITSPVAMRVLNESKDTVGAMVAAKTPHAVAKICEVCAGN